MSNRIYNQAVTSVKSKSSDPDFVSLGATGKTPIRSISGGAASTSSPASRQPAPPPLPTIKYATAAAAAVAQGASNPQGSHMGAAGSTTAGLTGGSVLSSSPTTSPAAEVISPQSPPATVADPSAKPVVESQPTQPVASAQVPADDLKGMRDLRIDSLLYTDFYPFIEI